MKNFLSLILIVLLTIGASDLLACKWYKLFCGANKNTSVSKDRIDNEQLGIAQPVESASGTEVGDYQFVEANVISVNDQGIKLYRCPVSGIENTVAADTRYIDYDSKRYYFNCPGTQEKFAANPEKYVVAINNDINRSSRRSCCPNGAKNAKVTKPEKSS